MTALTGFGTRVTYQPILDVARGIAAGFQAQTGGQARAAAAEHTDSGKQSLNGQEAVGMRSAAALDSALDSAAILPVNTFLSLPIDIEVIAAPAVRDVLQAHGDLSGIVLEVVGPVASVPGDDLGDTMAQYRDAGALIAVGGHGAPQPELTSIVRLKPSILRLGRDWVRGIDTSTAKLSAVEVIGRLAGQLDAWILAEGVSSAAELRALASLDVPLAQGSYIGEAQPVWPEISLTARTALPSSADGVAELDPEPGVLRTLIQQAYTTTDEAAASAVLPETTGFDVVVVLDGFGRPVSILEKDATESWEAADVLAVNVDTPVAAAAQRAMMRPRTTRFAPLACTDDTGRFLGVLRIERLMAHLAAEEPAAHV